MEALDLVTYPIAETIIYDMIHNRHKHRCEEHLIKQRSVSFQDTQNRRKHINSRRNDVSILFYSLCYFFIIFIYTIITETGESNQIIKHLVTINDPLIIMFKESELRSIKESS